MEISAVVPAYNAEKHISNCLKSILDNTFKVKEIIVVDDQSTDSTAYKVEKLKKNSEIPIRIIQTLKNSGPATARNLGAKVSKYEYIFFADSDTSLMQDTISIASQTLISNRDYISAVVGIYNISRTQNLIACFKTSYYFYLLGRTGIIEYDQFSASCALILKKDFFAVGGYDEWFKPKMDLENEELGYRLLKNKKIIFLDPNVRCDHTFPSNIKLLYLFFHRTSLWFEMYLSRRKQAAVKSIQKTGYVTLLPSLFSALLILSIYLKAKIIILITIFIFIFYLALNLPFFFYYSKKNLINFVLIFIASFLSHISISLGALFGLLKVLFKKSKIHNRFSK